MGHCCQDFIDAYNEMLAQLGCAARVAPPNGSWHRGSMMALAADGLELGIIPNTVEPIEFIAVISMVEKSFQRGLNARGSSPSLIG